ncbi:hypothetical protein LTR37_008968 [Vermiconidia calcicola]|uniref:Uncharacterized protein n=1 Tax=Vermiconidia calcicola TaxID=1690605 RepID=A0ACC3NBZ0_9PEZI|nr:hypothetical protein LTR37_008968 [Vermiconidia calcicola]
MQQAPCADNLAFATAGYVKMLQHTIILRMDDDVLDSSMMPGIRQQLRNPGTSSDPAPDGTIIALCG